jgi:hypothetical protein
MTITYHLPATITRTPRPLLNTAYSALPWGLAARLLRTAIANALQHAPQRKLSSEHVGGLIIDRIGELGPAELHVLGIAFSALVRASKRNT